MLAWGGGVQEFTSDIEEKLKKSNRATYVFRLNKKDGTPTHPSPRVESRFKYVQNFLKNSDLIEYK